VSLNNPKINQYCERHATEQKIMHTLF